MRSNQKLDKTDIKIIEELSNNPKSSLTDLAANTKISRPTVNTHLKSLSDSGLLLYKTGLSLKNMDFAVALVGLEAKHEQSHSQTEEYLSHCPRVLLIFRTSGKANLHVFVWGENDHTLRSTIEDFRNLPGTEVISTEFLGQPVYGDYIIDLSKEKSDKSPCGKVIHVECESYQNGECMGCPATRDYKGLCSTE